VLFRTIDQVKIGGVYCAITTLTHGKQLGKLNGTINNLSVGKVINLLNIAASYAAPLTFLHLYCESTWRIGSIVANASSAKTIIFQSCHFDFTNQNSSVRGVPANVLDGDQQNIHIRFVGCYFAFPSVLYFTHTQVEFDATEIRPSERTDDVSSQYIAYAHNALSGGIVYGSAAPPKTHRVKFVAYNLDTNALGSSVTAQDYMAETERKYCIPYGVRRCLATGDYTPIDIPLVRGFINKASHTLSVSERTLTLTFASRSEDTFAFQGGDVGDVILDVTTGTVFFVSSRTSLEITCIAQNNYKPDGIGGYELITALTTGSGTMYVINSRLYTPYYYLRGDLTASSATIASCARDDGFAAWYETYIAVDDWMYVDQLSDRYASPGNLKISARDQTAGTITLTGAVARTETRRRLKLFVRQAAANA
jgi:hypothetical protein